MTPFAYIGLNAACHGCYSLAAVELPTSVGSSTANSCNSSTCSFISWSPDNDSDGDDSCVASVSSVSPSPDGSLLYLGSSGCSFSQRTNVDNDDDMYTIGYAPTSALDPNQNSSATTSSTLISNSSQLITNLGVGIIPPVSGIALAGSLLPPQFTKKYLSVKPGDWVGIHWSPLPEGLNEFYTISSPSSLSSGLAGIPNFSVAGSQGGVLWPINSDAQWYSAYSWWQTTSNTMSVLIFNTSPVGTQYALWVTACLFITICSQSNQLIITVVGGWNEIPFGNVFQVSVNSVPQSYDPEGSPGNPEPVSVAIDSQDQIWFTTEFSNILGQLSSTLESTTVLIHNVYNNLPIPGNPTEDPFALCLFLVSSNPCGATDVAESEKVIVANNLVWFVEAGELGDITTPQTNHSQILEYDPSNGNMCQYIDPNNNASVMGLAATGNGTNLTIWFTETYGNCQPKLDAFHPQYPTSCPANNISETLVPYNPLSWQQLNGSPNPTAICSSSSSCNLYELLWPSGLFPAQIDFDPTVPALWVTNLVGS